jgi:sugar diacid utilization regulator
VASELQSLVDSLGRRVKRAVAIDDPHCRLIAYNSHFGAVDEVRHASIMHRKAPARAVAWVNAQGIRDAPGPMRIPAEPGMGMESRICAPIRCQGKLLGYVWLVDAGQTLDGGDLEAIRSAAQAAGEILHREQLLHDLERGRERELLRDLLSGQADVRAHAADELVEANLLVPTTAPVVLVVRLAAGPVTNADRISIELALDGVRRTVSPRHCLHLVRPDHGLVLLASEDPSLRPAGVLGFAQRLQGAASSRTARALVGVGDVRGDVSDIAASYEQALQAARVAEIVPSYAPVARWSELGIYRMLLQFPLDQLTSSVVHPGVLKLVAEEASDQLAQTLECWFDLAGDVKGTASRLGLHRATLYYRLHKVEKLAGVDLRKGDDRLALHLGLKLARLAGILPGASPAAAGRVAGDGAVPPPAAAVRSRARR